MKALIAVDREHYEMKEVPLPSLQNGEVLIKVEGCGICAGDIKARQGAARFWGGNGMPGYCEPPFIPGHEFFGRVVDVRGNAPGGFKPGDRVIPEQIVPCNECWYCRRGMYWLCDPHNVFGFKQKLNGGMAEYAVLPKGAILHRVPEEFTLAQAALIEPFACARHCVEQANPSHDDTVVLAGAGTLGLGMVQALQVLKPKKLIVLDLQNKRLDVAKRLGADEIINPAECDALDCVLEITQGVGCDIYIEATGHPSAVQQGLDMIRKGGRFVEFSVMSAPSTIDWSLIGDAKELTIIGSQLSPHCYEPVIECFGNGSLSAEGIVTHVFDLENWEAAFAMTQDRNALKVLIKP